MVVTDYVKLETDLLGKPEGFLEYEDGTLEDVPEEVPVQLWYNGREAATLLATPSDLRELGVGWLFSQGLIDGAQEVLAVRVCHDLRKVTVETTEDRWERKAGWRQLVTSGCGGGSLLLSQLYGVTPTVSTTVDVGVERLRFLMKRMLANATAYRRTGGIHSAALADVEGLLVQFEDIGRHNAVDKVLGRSLLTGLDFGKAMLLTTGRVSSEMLIKAAQAGIPTLATLSVPTSLAVGIARQCGVRLIGRANSHRPVKY